MSPSADLAEARIGTACINPPPSLRTHRVVWTSFALLPGTGLPRRAKTMSVKRHRRPCSTHHGMRRELRLADPSSHTRSARQAIRGCRSTRRGRSAPRYELGEMAPGVPQRVCTWVPCLDRLFVPVGHRGALDLCRHGRGNGATHRAAAHHTRCGVGYRVATRHPCVRRMPAADRIRCRYRSTKSESDGPTRVDG